MAGNREVDLELNRSSLNCWHFDRTSNVLYFTLEFVGECGWVYRPEANLQV